MEMQRIPVRIRDWIGCKQELSTLYLLGQIIDESVLFVCPIIVFIKAPFPLDGSNQLNIQPFRYPKKAKKKFSIKAASFFMVGKLDRAFIKEVNKFCKSCKSSPKI